MKKLITLILDLDGVLITTPPWRTNEIAEDGYSAFNIQCVNNLNALLQKGSFSIWLSSSRRAHKSILEFNKIFEFRGVKGKIDGFLPLNTSPSIRHDEVLEFIKIKSPSNFIIIDDDKSLNALPDSYKNKLVLTQCLTGLNEEKLQEALHLIC